MKRFLDTVRSARAEMLSEAASVKVPKDLEERNSKIDWDADIKEPIKKRFSTISDDQLDRLVNYMKTKKTFQLGPFLDKNTDIPAGFIKFAFEVGKEKIWSIGYGRTSN